MDFIKKLIIIIIIFINAFYISYSAIITGRYPYVKRLNNGYYAIASDNNITFTDSTLSTVVNTLNFNKIYERTDYIGSTTISQFPSEYNGYVVVILTNYIFFFSSIGNFLTNETTSIQKQKFPSFIFPIKYSSDNKYFFTLIYGSSDDDGEDSKFINFQKGTFDSTSNTINFTDPITYQPFENSKFYSTFYCDIMKRDDNEYIVCFYGTYQDLYASIFDPNNNYNCISTISNVGEGGMHFKSTVLLDERKKAMICVFKSGFNLKCYSYDITGNAFTSIVDNSFSINSCGQQPWSFIMEYFYETENFVIGCKGEDNSVYLAEFSKEFNFIKQNNLENAVSKDLYGNVVRYNIILANGQTKYNLFTYPNTDCSNNCPFEVIIQDFGVKLENLKEYPTTEPVSFICPIYYDYERINCIDTIPEGFYCNSTEQRTIDKC